MLFRTPTCNWKLKLETTDKATYFTTNVQITNHSQILQKLVPRSFPRDYFITQDSSKRRNKIVFP